MSESQAPQVDATGTIANHPELEALFTKRYGGATLEAIEKILVPAPVPILSIDKTVVRLTGGRLWTASFTIPVQGGWRELMHPGHTGKFVPGAYVDGSEPWREIAKGRLTHIDLNRNVAGGEIYVGTGGNKGELEEALFVLSDSDYLELDQYGASAKVLSALVEYSLARKALMEGFTVLRMPEDVARHIGGYYRHDFLFTKADGSSRRIEVKSLWGTNTRYARLIATKSKHNPTSSPRFDTQDIFAVSLFLRTGNINDFAFARSVPHSEEKQYGLPPSSKNPNHVHQNPVCNVGHGVWFDDINSVWELP